MKKIILFFLILIVFLTGCSQKIREGEVYKKEFRLAHTDVRVVPISISNGKTVTTTLIPFTYHYPNRWVIFIKAFKNNEWENAEYFVNKKVYKKINKGDEFKFVEGRDLEEEPYTRERNE